MKATAAPIIRRFGFRNVLIVNALISSAFLAATGFFTAGTAHAIIIATLLAGGFFRSLEFTSINALAYADIQQRDMSRATSFASVAQQVSLSLGVALGALILQGARGVRAETAITQSDFALAFWIVAAISALSVVSFLRLPIGAGEEMAGTSPGSAAVTPATGANPHAEASIP